MLSFNNIEDKVRDYLHKSFPEYEIYIDRNLYSRSYNNNIYCVFYKSTNMLQFVYDKHSHMFSNKNKKIFTILHSIKHLSITCNDNDIVFPTSLYNIEPYIVNVTNKPHIIFKDVIPSYLEILEDKLIDIFNDENIKTNFYSDSNEMMISLPYCRITLKVDITKLLIDQSFEILTNKFLSKM